MSITSLLAFYGAATATAAALWNIYQYHSDRRLLVNAYIGYQPQAPQEKLLTIDIVNTGKRPIRLQGIEIQNTPSRKPSQSQFKQIIPDKWPRTLNEGETFTIIIPKALLSEFAMGNYSYIYVRDSINKRWHIRLKNSRRLCDEYLKL